MPNPSGAARKLHHDDRGTVLPWQLGLPAEAEFYAHAASDGRKKEDIEYGYDMRFYIILRAAV